MDNNNNNITSINNSVETVNAAATAIVSAETRVQPTSVQKRRWGGCWSLYSCFGTYKHSKQISHVLLAPESAPPGPTPLSVTQNNNSTAIVFPFIAPPSSPASFLQSDPPSASYSPVGLLSFKSCPQNPNSQVPTSIFTIGPYAYETHLVSPPVFSTYTTEPSTASFTPPPESVQMTTPSSPEVPFAQLLTSSLARARRHSMGSHQKYDFQSYSPGGGVMSPGSTIPNSGTSSPFPDKQHRVLKLRVGDDNKFIGYEYFSTRGSRFGSESGTPNGVSGSATPYGYGLGSRVGSGSLTPNVVGEMYLMESQISEVASLANSATSSPKRETLVDHRVSFELTNLDVISGVVNNLEASFIKSSGRKMVSNICEDCANKKTSGEILDKSKERECQCKRASVSKDFNFDSANGVELGSQNNWTFFPALQSSVKPS
ncbi:uncharacterized protein LOC143553086 [Bidens hawaiensis]|uniref:uncharacterized protein LOC143553086 n=1 Tax=Bidens hawaiensis TaxID=980011 RepID=UPI004048EB02